jgi:polysaccharide pyruvyl transferase WcaK-like protein
VRSSGTPVIYLVGTSGHPNYGDELITAGWLRHYARALPDALVILDTQFPGHSASLFNGLHPRLRCVDTLYHACWNAPSGSLAETLDFGQQIVGNPGLVPREATAIEDLSEADVVHILGGGYLNAIWPSHLTLVGSAVGIAERYGARTAMTGAGLLPLVDDDAETLGKWLSRFDVVDTRDTGSFQALTPTVPHATCTGDDAFLGLGESPGNSALPGGPVAGGAGTVLNLQSDLLDFPLERLADFAVSTLRAWGVDQEPVTLVDSLPPLDLAVLPLLQPHLPELQVLQFADIWRQGLPAHPGQRWVTTRFHTHLVAASAGAWGVAIPINDQYYRPKHQSLVDLGSLWLLAEDLDEPAPSMTPPDQPFGGNLPALTRTKAELADSVLHLLNVSQ